MTITKIDSRVRQEANDELSDNKQRISTQQNTRSDRNRLEKWVKVLLNV